MPSPRTLSASSTPPPADCNPQTVVLEGDLDKSGEATVPNETGKGDEDDASSCLSSEFDPADEMDPDFYYGPKPVDDATAISEDEMSLQVAIALQHLERLQMLSGDPQLKALFVRWTIHNWATQGPFNIHAYKETLEEFFAARNCSEEAISGDDAGETFETTIAKFEGGCADQTQEGAHVAQDAAMAPAAASRDQVEEALDVELGPRMESKVGSWGAWPEDEAKSALVRRVRCKGRWSRPLAAHDDDVPLGHISGAGSVIVASHAPAAFTAGDCQFMGPDCSREHADMMADEFADGILAGLEESAGQKRGRPDEGFSDVDEREAKHLTCARSSTVSPGGSECSTVPNLSIPPSPERPAKFVPIGRVLPLLVGVGCPDA